MQDRMDESRKRQQYSPKEIERFNQREMELLSLREHIEEQEKQLDEYRSKLENDQLNREREFQIELDKREQFFSEREKKFAERQREFEEHFHIQQMETEKLKNRLKRDSD
jgi:hypothetical protein